MRVFVKVKARARRESVERIDDAHFTVAVKDPPVDGKANAAVLEALSDYFKVPRSRVRLLSGQSSKNKVFEVAH